MHIVYGFNKLIGATYIPSSRLYAPKQGKYTLFIKNSQDFQSIKNPAKRRDF